MYISSVFILSATQLSSVYSFFVYLKERIVFNEWNGPMVHENQCTTVTSYLVWEKEKKISSLVG